MRHIAVIGSGPAGFYTAEAALKTFGGEVRNAAGAEAKLQLVTPNGYDITVTASLGIVEHLLNLTSAPAGGYFTPSQLMGKDYVLQLPGVRLLESAAA